MKVLWNVILVVLCVLAVLSGVKRNQTIKGIRDVVAEQQNEIEHLKFLMHTSSVIELELTQRMLALEEQQMKTEMNRADEPEYILNVPGNATDPLTLDGLRGFRFHGDVLHPTDEVMDEIFEEFIDVDRDWETVLYPPI